MARKLDMQRVVKSEVTKSQEFFFLNSCHKCEWKIGAHSSPKGTLSDKTSAVLSVDYGIRGDKAAEILGWCQKQVRS